MRNIFSVRQRIPLVSLPITHFGNNWVLWNSSLFELFLSICFFFVVVGFHSDDYCEACAKCWAHDKYMFNLFELQVLNQQIFIDMISTVDSFTLFEIMSNVTKPLIESIQPTLLECHDFNIKATLKGFLTVATYVSFLRDVRVNVLQTSRWWWCWFNIIIFSQICDELSLYIEDFSTYSDVRAIRLHKTILCLNEVVCILMIFSFIYWVESLKA